jgi:Family of unknown function (DUF5681)
VTDDDTPAAEAAPPNAGPKAGRAPPFLKGKSGNPRGKKPGTKHRKTVLLAAMTTDDRTSIMAKIIKQARNGCRASQKLIVDRIEPPRRARVKFKLLPIANVDDVVAAFDHVAAAVAQGALTLDEAAAASMIIEKTRDAIRNKDLADRLAKLEERFVNE